MEAVRGIPGVRAASWSPRTRGLLILHEDDADTDAMLDAIARHTGVEHVDAPSRVPTDAPKSVAAATTAVFGELNARVTRATGGLVTLGTLLPLALTLWAGREILRGRTAPLAWSSALWYAHGLFRDYGLPSRDD